MARWMGRYELISQLGRGGMAEVFLARRRGLGGVEKRLVVKCIRPERAGDARFHDMFVQEARLSMLMAHKNIVPVFDFGRAGDELFLAMEYIEGRDLAATLRKARDTEQIPSPMLVAFIAMEACSALEHAQRVRGEDGESRAIIHRDVSPRNVMVSFAGEVKLVDFGVAISDVDSIGKGRTRGTPAYMSPEQAWGRELDVRSDLFALGAVMWEALAGRAPRTASTPEKMLEIAKTEDLPPLPDSVPADLADIVRRATCGDPTDRFTTAQEMQLALDRFVMNERVRGDAAPPAVELTAWMLALFPERGLPPVLGGARTASTPSPTAVDDGEGWRAPEGPVVTYLDDGDRAIGAVTEAPGQRTMRSLAETAMEPDDVELPDGSVASYVGESTAEPQPGPRRRFPSVWIGAAAAVAGAAIIAVLGSSAGTTADRAKPVEAPRKAAAAPDATGVPPAPDSTGVDPAATGQAAAVSADLSVRAPTSKTEPDRLDDPGEAATVARPSPTTTVSNKRPAVAKPQTAPRPAARKEPAPTRDSAAVGSLRVSSAPWAEVRVNGRSERCPETPCTLRLPPGKYVLTLVNPPTGASEQVTATVTSGEQKLVRATLRGKR